MDQRLRILVIDDDRDDFFLASEMLVESFGGDTQLEWAATYDAGLNALARDEFDVCLLDYQLGAKTGLELLWQAKLRGYETPVILLTGQGQREVDLQAMEAGAADFLTKESLRAESLERSVRHSLERHRDRQALCQLNEMLESRVEQRTRELEKANQALQRADRRKDEFLAILAHELRNPLAPINNSLEVMNRTPDDEQACREARATMRRQLDQLVRLTDDLLEISRISRGKIELRKDRILLGDVISQAVEAAQPWIDARRQRLQVRTPSEEIQLTADRHRLAQVVGNLLNNASKFSEPEGAVELVVEHIGNDAVIKVRDEGIGIERDQLECIFDIFQQVDTSLERSEAGLGIGLTLVRKLTEMHGGSVAVHSPGLGQGSEFTVSLPLLESTEARPAEREREATRDSKKTRPRVLVVDDNRDSAASMAMLLKLSGYQVSTAFTGQDAIEKVAADAPRIVLLDIGLPDFNGYEVARRLRESHSADELKLVALTGWGQDSDRRRAEEAGFDHHLLKPVEFPTLLELLSDLSASGPNGARS